MIDVWFTYLMLKTGGMELNPIIVASMKSFGIIEGILLVKLPILAIIGLVVWLCHTGRWISDETTIGRWLHVDVKKTLNFCIAIYLGVDTYTFILLHT